MVKAKFGALALTVLMGLGAVSPLHGATEAHALNAHVANSAQQKTVVSTTDDSDGVMSYKDKESGKTFVSEDNGASWMSEEDYRIPLIIAPKPSISSPLTKVSRKSAIQTHCLHEK